MAPAQDAFALRCDVASEADVASAFDAALARFGRVDVIVNNAGTMIFKPIEAHDEADLLRVVGVDFFGAFWFVKQAFLKCRPGAAIVNVSSIDAIETTPLVSAYAAAKSTLLSLTRSAAIEGRSKGIRVHAVRPGAIETPMRRDNRDVKSGVKSLAPGDVGQPEDAPAPLPSWRPTTRPSSPAPSCASTRTSRQALTDPRPVTAPPHGRPSRSVLHEPGAARRRS